MLATPFGGLWLGRMSNLGTLGPSSDDLAAVRQELRRLMQAGQSAVNVFHIVQVGDRTLTLDQAARLLPEFSEVLSGSVGKPDPSDAGLGGGSKPSPAREAFFRFDGRDTWEIGFKGQVCLYRDAVGLHQVCYLLLRRAERVPVIDLAEVRGQQIVINQLCSEDIADEKAFAQWKGQINSLRDQLKIAEETGNIERESELRIEGQALLHQISCAQSHRGIRRKLGAQTNRLRNRVCFTIRKSLEKISDRTPDLAEHLLASIKLGFDCGYFPLTTVRWTLQHGLAGGHQDPRIARSELAQ
jgi:hypothetical protein